MACLSTRLNFQVFYAIFLIPCLLRKKLYTMYLARLGSHVSYTQPPPPLHITGEIKSNGGVNLIK